MTVIDPQAWKEELARPRAVELARSVTQHLKLTLPATIVVKGAPGCFDQLFEVTVKERIGVAKCCFLVMDIDDLTIDQLTLGVGHYVRNLYRKFSEGGKLT